MAGGGLWKLIAQLQQCALTSAVSATKEKGKGGCEGFIKNHHTPLSPGYKACWHGDEKNSKKERGGNAPNNRKELKI